MSSCVSENFQNRQTDNYTELFFIRIRGLVCSNENIIFINAKILIFSFYALIFFWSKYSAFSSECDMIFIISVALLASMVSAFKEKE